MGIYEQQLRKRLHELPGTYEYAMHRAVRQLFPVCNRIAVWTGLHSAATPAETEALLLDLYTHTLRGIVIGVAGLAWHGLGFDPECPQTKAQKTMNYLREKGPTTKSDLLRHGARLKKTERDPLLERLVDEDLVRMEGKIVTATTYSEFVTALHAREEFPQPKNHWAEIKEKSNTAA